MKKKYVLLSLSIAVSTILNGQTCGVAQVLNSTQKSSISSIMVELDSALKYENEQKIDSLSFELKKVFSNNAGIPESIETYYSLLPETNWLNSIDALKLSRSLINKDSTIYTDLWKLAKGRKPDLYLEHSIFLRTSAEVASGLYKIANKESDPNRKSLYLNLANRALDSLATMQLPSGAFPFPDLRTYGDPVFSTIIQNFLNQCGPDSTNVLKSGWIIDDKGTGEFSFDAGVIANSYYEAYNFTGNINYKNKVISIGNYLLSVNFNRNYNYNTFVSLGLTRAFQLSNDSIYLKRAFKILRFAIFPGQASNGRWLDGHNANSRYHSIIVQNIIPTVLLIPINSPYKLILSEMTNKAVSCLVDYTYKCQSATAYRWLLSAYKPNLSIFSETLNDSIKKLIGQHINQSNNNGKYLDVPTMGEYIQLLGMYSQIENKPKVKATSFSITPNPVNSFCLVSLELTAEENIHLFITDQLGVTQIDVVNENTSPGNYTYSIDLSQLQEGVYVINCQTKNSLFSKKLVKLN